MTHRAETILDAVETTLTGLTTTGVNVQRGILYELVNVPALIIEKGTDNTLGEQGSNNLSFIDRELNVKVTAVVEVNSNQETALNIVGSEVYAALLADYTLGLSFVANCWLLSDSEPFINTSGQTPVATMEMNYSIQYRHSATDTGA